MKSLKLSPFVYKVKGSKGWALYELLNGYIFQLLPGEENVELLKKQLVDLNIAYETEGVIPVKYEKSMDDIKKRVRIIDLQIRISGECNLDCDDCGSICSCFKSRGTMNYETLSSIFKQFEYITLERVSVVGGNPLIRPDILEAITKYLHANRFCVMFKGGFENAQKGKLEKLGIEIAEFPARKKKLSEKELRIDAFSFFYNRIFNPCWGNKIAIDMDGQIKNCLWSTEVFGNIREVNLKRILLTGILEQTWELTKDKIEVCSSCEYRYACSDCRVAALSLNKNIREKTLLCDYNPDTASWTDNKTL